MDWDTWRKMTPAERDAARDTSDLHPKLIGLEGRRVRIEPSGDMSWLNGKPMLSFIVGRTTGWKPMHVALRSRVQHGSSDLINPRAVFHFVSVD